MIRLTTFSFQFLVALFTEHPAAKPGDLRFNFKSWRKTRILLRLDLPLATSIYFLFPFPLSKSLKNCYFGNFSIKKIYWVKTSAVISAKAVRWTETNIRNACMSLKQTWRLIDISFFVLSHSYLNHSISVY